MENPLAKFVDIEERSDGVYLRVTRKKRDTLSIHEMIRALESAQVTNYDLHLIEEVVRRARGGFERVGPPFEYFDPAFDSRLDIKIEQLTAVMRLHGDEENNSIRPTSTMLRYCLKRRGIVFGIREDVLESFVGEPKYDCDLQIARGKPPENGADGVVELLVQVDPTAKPAVDSSGKVDFREIQSFTAVQKDQPLARRLPPQEGVAGISVSGEAIPANSGKEVTLPQGKNTAVTEDGLYLTATEAGVVYREAGLIHIKELLSIKGDVNYSVGNIKYGGDVVIEGSVKPGFTVESEGDIRIGGEIEAAKVISRNGIVEIGRGIIGKNDTLVSGRMGVHIGFVQDATIVSEGTVTIDKYCLHCSITCESLEGGQNDSSLVGGEVHAFGHVSLAQIGNESAVHTKIALLNKQKVQAQEKTKELLELKAKIEKELEPLAKDLRSKSAIMKMAGSSVGDKHRLELKKIIDGYNALGGKVKYVNTKLEELKKIIESDIGTDGHVRVLRNIFPGTELDFYGIARKTIDTKMTSKVFRMEAGSIHMEG